MTPTETSVSIVRSGTVVVRRMTTVSRIVSWFSHFAHIITGGHRITSRGVYSVHLCRIYCAVVRRCRVHVWNMRKFPICVYITSVPIITTLVTRGATRSSTRWSCGGADCCIRVVQVPRSHLLVNLLGRWSFGRHLVPAFHHKRIYFRWAAIGKSEKLTRSHCFNHFLIAETRIWFSSSTECFPQ